MSTNNPKPVLKHLKEHFNSENYFSDVGSIDLLSKTERIAARIFVNKSEVYAIEVSNFPLEIIRRIITSEYVSERMREEILSKYGQDLTNPEVVSYCSENKIVPDEVLEEYRKDLFLGACDYVALLSEATFKWNPNVYPSKLTTPPVNLEVLWNIVENRQKEMLRMANVFNVGVDKIRDLDFKKIPSAPPAATQDEANIYSLASGEWSILDFARQFGMSLFLAATEMEQLWLKQGIELIYDSEFKIRPTLEQVEETHLLRTKEPTVLKEKVEEVPVKISSEKDATDINSNKNKASEIEKLKEEISYIQLKLEEIKSKLEGLDE